MPIFIASKLGTPFFFEVVGTIPPQHGRQLVGKGRIQNGGCREDYSNNESGAVYFCRQDATVFGNLDFAVFVLRFISLCPWQILVNYWQHFYFERKLSLSLSMPATNEQDSVRVE